MATNGDTKLLTNRLKIFRISVTVNSTVCLKTRNVSIKRHGNKDVHFTANNREMLNLREKSSSHFGFKVCGSWAGHHKNK